MSRIEAPTLERDDEAGMIVLDAARPWRHAGDAPPPSDPCSLDLGWPGCIWPGSIWFVGARGAGGPALAADVVVHDRGLEAAAAQLSPGCYRELAAIDPLAASDRLKKLAGEGWRVVRFVAGDPAATPRAAAELALLAGSGLRVGTFAASVAFVGPAPRPQLFTAGGDGLAG